MTAEKDSGLAVHESLVNAIDLLDIFSKSFKKLASAGTTVRAKRMELMLEEMAEVADAMRRGNEIDLADGLADLLYVVYGTAIAFGIPIESVFREVHRSNMTKNIGANKHHEGGDKGKGVDYVPADIKQAIDRAPQDYAQLRETRRAVERINLGYEEAQWIDKEATKSVKISVGDALTLKEAL